MDIESINDKIRMKQLELSLEDSSNRRNKILTQLKILQLQKNVEQIKTQINQLRKR